MTDGRGTLPSYFEILSKGMKNGQNEARLEILGGPHRSKKALNKRKYSSVFPQGYHEKIFPAATITKLSPFYMLSPFKSEKSYI